MPHAARIYWTAFAAALIGTAAPAAAQYDAPPPGASAITDARDGARYRTVRIGRLDWFAENLRSASPDSRCYGDAPHSCEELGRLYKLQAAYSACPADWRLSSDADWQAMERILGMSDAVIAQRDGRGGDVDRRLYPGGDLGFDTLLAGYWDGYKGAYVTRGRNAAFWTSTEDVPGRIWHRDISPRRGGIWRSPVSDKYWLSIRCVRPASPG